jgi:16S rRNA (adenine1518-N6/adenine1519-N6)-dimethyltransferase
LPKPNKEIATPAPTLARITRELLASYDRRPRKRLGQHFLVDSQVLQRIIKAAELSKDDLVVEIGSGLGVVTAELARRAGQVLAIEIDKELLKISQAVLSPCDNIRLLNEDILKVELDKLVEGNNCCQGKSYKLVANLPYYITAPIIEKILTAKNKPRRAVLMVQKEVAERIVSPPGSKQYGSFSIFVQFYSHARLDSFVSKSSFHPWPAVGSALVVLEPYLTPKYPVGDTNLFFNLVHDAFQQRRKKLKNSLAKYNLAGIDFDLTLRPERVSVEGFAAISNFVELTPSSPPLFLREGDGG